jgi:hypothetical protein
MVILTIFSCKVQFSGVKLNYYMIYYQGGLSYGEEVCFCSNSIFTNHYYYISLYNLVNILQCILFTKWYTFMSTIFAF